MITQKYKKSLLLKLMAAASVAIMTTACSAYTPSRGNVFEENKFQISERIERLELYPQANGLQLNPRDMEAVHRFLRDFGQNGDGQIFMNIPVNQSRNPGAQQAQTIIKSALAQSGFGQANIQTGQYQAGTNIQAPIVVSYRKFSTLIPRCNIMSDLRLNSNNQYYDGFGCAHFANQAAMIGDHRQLLRPYDLSPADPARRSAVYQSYIDGEDPSSANGSRQAITFGN